MSLHTEIVELRESTLGRGLTDDEKDSIAGMIDDAIVAAHDQQTEAGIADPDICEDDIDAEELFCRASGA